MRNLDGVSSDRRRDHRVVALYGEDEAAMFPLRRDATLAELCEALARRAPRRGAMPIRVEVSLGR